MRMLRREAVSTVYRNGDMLNITASGQGNFSLGFAFAWLVEKRWQLKSYKVLVVDDSKLARMAVAKLLEALHPDWTRIEAASAEEALAVLDAKGSRSRGGGLQHAGARRTGPCS